MKKKLNIEDWILFRSYGDGISDFDVLGKVKEFDEDGDPGILPYDGRINTKDNREQLWYRFKKDYRKISEDEAILWILENS